MSLKTWKAEFYPVDADEVRVEDAIDHSLTKWIGLRPENLAKHQVTSADYHGVTDGADRMYVGGDACALCHLHHDEDWYEEDDEEEGVGDACGDCPLKLARGGVPCDNVRKTEQKSPWGYWNDRNDPEPMILWLTRAKAGELHPND